ncbi:MAG TPA: hypothetical protein VLY04_02940 [Bryobacteraceae bacterium]|nr:hypothetical protein [Bryobacteraceae bacterium]
MKTALLLFAAATCAMAQTVTLTMDEVPAQPINGLTVTKGGLGFTFSEPSGTLLYNTSNGGTITYVQDPTIEGANVPFSVTFSAPVYSVQFGLAVNVQHLVSPIATVSLYSGSASPFATLTLNSTLADPFSEGQFFYTGVAITKILVTPSTNVGFTAIGFDNLSVNLSPVTVPAASPLTLAITAAALVGLAVFSLRKVFA